MGRREGENEVVTLRAFGEILLGVINDAIGADGAYHLHLPRTAHAGHICAEGLGDLHSERTHASPGAVDQDLLPRPNLSLVAKTLQCRKCRHRYRSRLLKRHVIGLHDQCGFASARILGKGSAAHAEHLVAWFEMRHVPADRFDLAGHITSRSHPWFAQPEYNAKEVRP